MKKYTCKVPFQSAMGSISPFEVNESTMESKEEYALWVINDMRDHDGFRRLASLPSGTTFERIKC